MAITDDAPTDAREPPRRRPGRWIALASAGLLAAYVASPWVAALGLARAIRDGDAAGVARRIDPPAVRRSIARQLVAARLGEVAARRGLGPLERSLAAGTALRALEAWLADLAPDDALAEIVAGRRGVAEVRGRRVDLSALSDAPRAFDDLWQVWLGSGFEGPFAYALSARRTAPLAPDLGLELTGGGWVVRRLALPAPVIERLAEAWLERAKPSG